MRKGLIFLLIGGILMLSLTGCFGGNTYQVDYGGQKDCFTHAKDSYRAGAQVTLYYGLIATDTDYSFYLDGEQISPDYDEKHGFIIRFTMPDHDVKLRVESVNSMEYRPERDVEPQKEWVLTFDSFDGGGPDYTATADDPSLLEITSERVYQSADHAELDGAGYQVRFTFRGLQPGTALVTVSARSPVGDSFDAFYGVIVYDDLTIGMAKLYDTNEES